MGKKNNVLVGYFDDARRFADICNGFFYGGRQVIRPELLEEASEKYDTPFVKDDGRDVRSETVERIRDIKKRYLGQTLRIIGLEDMNGIDYTVGVRNMQYDAMEYGRQLERIRRRHKRENDYATEAERICGFRKGDKLTAVSTLWLYHGALPYDGPRSLREMLDIGADMEMDKIADYPVNLLCVDETLDIEAFRTEVRQLFKVMQRRGDKKALRELFETDDDYRELDPDTVEAISAALDRPGIWKNRQKYMREGGSVNMCKAMDDWEAEAREEGREEGKNTLRVELTMKKLAKGNTPAEIADALEEEVSVIENICRAIEKCGTGGKVQHILEKL